MHKKIFIMSLLISLASVAHNLPEEQTQELKIAQEKKYAEHKTVKKQKLIEFKAAQEKHKLEQEKAISDITMASYFWTGSCLIDFLPERTLALSIANLCLTAYAIYKAANGFGHLIVPDFPNPEDKEVLVSNN
jgi:predicted DNA-binding protein (MmcQ/YjbR family)